jgi:hypothetical protein
MGHKTMVEELPVDLAAALGAEPEASIQQAMKKRIRITSGRPRAVRSTTRTARSIDPRSFAEQLGADPLGLAAGTNVPALDALQRTLLLTLRSQGGRPALDGAVRRQKIPMTDADWEALENIARSLQAKGLNATAGQVGGQLLHDAIAHLDTGPRPYPPTPAPPSFRVSEPISPPNPGRKRRR